MYATLITHSRVMISHLRFLADYKSILLLVIHFVTCVLIGKSVLMFAILRVKNKIVTTIAFLSIN